VNAELAEVFQWAELTQLRAWDLLMEIGRAKIRDTSKPDGTFTNAIISPAAFTGIFKKTIDLRGGGTAIRTEMPVRDGDSGGPVFTTDGELLGIMCGSAKPVLRREYDVVNRPDLKWLNDTINRDTNRHAKTIAPNQPFDAADKGDPITLTIPLLR
jgi:hypothetical protein